MGASDFRIIQPITITDAMLVSSNVPETVAATYSSGTTYSIGDKVGLAPVDGQAQIVYKSLQNSNHGNTPASSPTWWLALGNVYPLYNSDSPPFSYSLGDIVSDISTDVHQLYESLADGNAGNPLTDTLKWLPLGATNRWKAFDKIANSQTENGGSIVYNIIPSTLVNAIAFINLSASSITISQSTTGYSKTILLNTRTVKNWYDWWYKPIRTKDDAVIMDLPPFTGETVTITITGTTAKVGGIFFGWFYSIGTTEDGLTRSIKDFSRVTEDAFGGLLLTPGNYIKLLDCNFLVDQGFEDDVIHILSSLRSKEIVVVSCDNFDSAILYCVIKDWSVPKSQAIEKARISLRGLI